MLQSMESQTAGHNLATEPSDGDSGGEESLCNAADPYLIPGSGRSSGGHGNPLQCSCLENSIDEESGGLQSMGLQRIGRD